jgi:carbon starvation protein
MAAESVTAAAAETYRSFEGEQTAECCRSEMKMRKGDTIMTGLLIVGSAIVLLVLGYIFYGSWLEKQWGVDPSRKTPAVDKEDGVDYVPAKPAVLMGHHFSSIAGAGPVNGPVQASIFGWVPVFLWCIIGGIFMGGVQDFSALFASIRHDGKSLGELIDESLGRRLKKIFIIFTLLLLLLVIASFVNIVAGTFCTAADAAGRVAAGIVSSPNNNQATTMISMLFIVMAVVYGLATNRYGVKTIPATIAGVIGIAAIIALGLHFGISLSRTQCIVVIGIYIAAASLVPVWILLQPRDYLSSFLLYGMIILALVGIAVSAFTGSVTFDMPAFTSFEPVEGQYLFPILFITIACGACSGFHSLVSSGTSSKQLNNEKNARPISYGSMLIESAFAIIALVALGGVYSRYVAGEFGSPAAAFAAGTALMFGPENSTIYNIVSALLTLSVSVFALTSLDTGTRLSRFMFTELFLKEGESTYKDAKGIRRVLAHPLFGTTFMVVVGCILGGLSLSQVWGMLGEANQLLSGIAFMTVAVWLGKIGKNNKMLFFPMIFMLAASLASLVLTMVNKSKPIAAGTAVWGDWFQLIFALVTSILAIILIVEGVKVFRKQAGEKQAARS